MAIAGVLGEVILDRFLGHIDITVGANQDRYGATVLFTEDLANISLTSTGGIAAKTVSSG